MGQYDEGGFEGRHHGWTNNMPNIGKPGPKKAPVEAQLAMMESALKAKDEKFMELQSQVLKMQEASAEQMKMMHEMMLQMKKNEPSSKTR